MSEVVFGDVETNFVLKSCLRNSSRDCVDQSTYKCDNPLICPHNIWNVVIWVCCVHVGCQVKKKKKNTSYTNRTISLKRQKWECWVECMCKIKPGMSESWPQFLSVNLFPILVDLELCFLSIYALSPRYDYRVVSITKCGRFKSICSLVIAAERIFEDHENLVENLLNWTRDSQNKLMFVERIEKYALFKNPQVSLRFMLNVCACMHAWLQFLPFFGSIHVHTFIFILVHVLKCQATLQFGTMYIHIVAGTKSSP